MVSKLRGLGLIVVLLVLSACGSSGGTAPTPPPAPPPAPKIDIFATSVSNKCGVNLDDGLQFFIQVNENLQFISVNISHQFAGSLGSFNLGNQLAITGQQFSLQAANECFLKVTGEYRFVFAVTRPNDPNVFNINSVYTQTSAIRQ